MNNVISILKIVNLFFPLIKNINNYVNLVILYFNLKFIIWLIIMYDCDTCKPHMSIISLVANSLEYCT